MQLKTLIEDKLAHGDVLETARTLGETGETGEGGEVLDLMEALQRSVDRSRSAKKKSTARTSRKDASSA